MKLAWAVAWKDSVLRFQSRIVLVFVIALPLAMTVVTGLAFKGMEPGSLVGRVALVVEGPAPGEEVAQALSRLESWPAGEQPLPESTSPTPGAFAGARLEVVKSLTAEEARRQLADEEIHGAIIIPPGFADDFRAGRRLTFTYLTNTNQALEGSIVDLALQWFLETLRQREERPVEVVRETIGEPQRLVGFNSFSQAVAGNGVMFILLNCMTMGGVALIRERRLNTLSRMLISPMKPRTLLLGKVLGVCLIGLVQAVVVFGFGTIIGVLDGVDMLGIVLITLLLILMASALGLLISALARREETVEAVGPPVALVMTALGGGMFPVEMAPEWLQSVSFFLPTGWAMHGYHQLIWFGQGTADILPNLAVLAGFTVVFFVLGIRSLRWE